MLSERFYGGIGEKSIGYPRKVYRVFSDRTVHPLHSLPSSAPFPSYNRSVFTHLLPQNPHPPLRYLRTNDSFPPIPFSVSSVQTIRLPETNDSFAPKFHLNNSHPLAHHHQVRRQTGSVPSSGFYPSTLRHYPCSTMSSSYYRFVSSYPLTHHHPPTTPLSSHD